MNTQPKTTLKNNASIFLAVLFSLGFVASCSQHNPSFKMTHPGKYELIDLGKVDTDPASRNPYYSYKVHDKIIHAAPYVVNPSYFSLHLLENTEVHKGESVLDIGAGTGVQAVFAAEKASHVLAMDISKPALDNTLLNARRLGVADKISVRESDLFNALGPDEKFDVIISSIPFAMNANTQGNWTLQERFFHDVRKHLNPNGRIYFSTGNLENMSRTRKLAETSGLKIIHINMNYVTVQHIEPIVYVFKHAEAAMWTKEDLINAKQKE